MDPQTPLPPIALPVQTVSLVPEGFLCRRCSYDLANLPPSGVCPECGKPIEESLRGDLIRYADAAYITKLRLGVRVILACILASVILIIGSLGLGIAVGVGGLTLPPGAEFLISVLSFVVSITSIYGYFLFSTPDPGVSPGNRGDFPRQVLRIAIIGQAVVTPISSFGELLLPIAPAGAMAGGALSPVFIAGIALALVSVVAWAAQFFAAMRYMRWLAPRIPDAKMFQQAKTYQWVLPLWYIPGSCILVGPLVALVLYYNFFNDLRKHLGHIAQAMGPPDPLTP